MLYRACEKGYSFNRAYMSQNLELLIGAIEPTSIGRCENMQYRANY